MLLERNNGMRFTNLIAAVLALMAYRTALYSYAAGPKEGENAKAFALLCEIVTTAEDAAAETVSLKPTEETTNAIALINLLLTAPETLEQLLPQTSRDAILAGSGATAHKICTENHLINCTAALTAAEQLTGSGVKELIESFKKRSKLLDAINRTVKKIDNIIETIKIQEQVTANDTIKRLTSKAIYGKGQLSPAFNANTGATTRKSRCGQKDAQAGQDAGTSLAVDLICICAGDSDNPNNKGCYGTSPGQVTFAQASPDATNAWAQIKHSCSRVAHMKGGTAARLRRATADVYHLLLEPKGSDKKIGYLGHIEEGHPAGDCSANNNDGGGACVHYGLSDGIPKKPEWMTAIENLADEIEKSENNTRATAQKLEKIEALNRTLNNLITMNTAYHQLASTVSGTKETQSTENKPSVAAATCNSAGEDQQKCKALEKEGCSFNTDSKKCELKEEVKEKLEKEIKETTEYGKTNTTKSKSFVIKKAPLLLAFLLF